MAELNSMVPIRTAAGMGALCPAPGTWMTCLLLTAETLPFTVAGTLRGGRALHRRERGVAPAIDVEGSFAGGDAVEVAQFPAPAVLRRRVGAVEFAGRQRDDAVAVGDDP